MFFDQDMPRDILFMDEELLFYLGLETAWMQCNKHPSVCVVVDRIISRPECIGLFGASGSRSYCGAPLIPRTCSQQRAQSSIRCKQVCSGYGFASCNGVQNSCFH